MNLFRMPKPRGFNHNYIYYDERRARLREIEERARRELGMEQSGGYDADRIRGAFASGTRHSRRARERRSHVSPRLNVAVLVILLIALLALLRSIG